MTDGANEGGKQDPPATVKIEPAKMAEKANAHAEASGQIPKQQAPLPGLTRVKNAISGAWKKVFRATAAVARKPEHNNREPDAEPKPEGLKKKWMPKQVTAKLLKKADYYGGFPDAKKLQAIKEIIAQSLGCRPENLIGLEDRGGLTIKITDTDARETMVIFSADSEVPPGKATCNMIFHHYDLRTGALNFVERAEIFNDYQEPHYHHDLEKVTMEVQGNGLKVHTFRTDKDTGEQ